MHIQRLLVTGGAGFVGSTLAFHFKRAGVAKHVVALDNLMRRGSELNLSMLRDSGVEFVHGDVRCADDLARVDACDLLIDCAAEPSVHAGGDGNIRRLIDLNLNGTVNCLEWARRHGAAILFLSTSRVYPIQGLANLAYDESETRLALRDDQVMTGASGCGISEDFPLEGSRSFYGATKLASELLLKEYVYNCGVKALINRCGLLAGPRQMGREDQGVVTLWVARHLFSRSLKYIGYGGTGKQVRDILHVDDLFDLLVLQLADIGKWSGDVYNVGGGIKGAVSLMELTAICQEVTGRHIPLEAVPLTSPVDIPVYISDNRKVSGRYGWSPVRSPRDTAESISDWINHNREQLAPILA